MTNKIEKKFNYTSIIFAVLIVLLAFSVILTNRVNWNDVARKNVLSVSCDLSAMSSILLFYSGVRKNVSKTRKERLLIVVTVLLFMTILADISRTLFLSRPSYKQHITYCFALYYIMMNLCSWVFYLYTRCVTGATGKLSLYSSVFWLIVSGLVFVVNTTKGFVFYVNYKGEIVQNGILYYLSILYPAIIAISCAVCGHKHHVHYRYIFVIYCFTVAPLFIAYIFKTICGADLLLPAMTIADFFAYNVLFTDLERESSSLQNAFERFYSDDVIKSMIDTSSGKFVEAKYRMATILTVDIRGFTSISQRLLPSKLVDMINHYFGVMNEIIERNGGVVLEFLGDGFTAIFGAPIYINNYIEKACSAAIQMQNTVNEINVWNKEHGYPEIEIGVGINTGEVLMGSFGSEFKASLKAIGDEADFSSYIESLSTGGTVLISRSTLDELRCEHQAVAIFDEQDGNEKKEKDIYRLESLGEPYNVSVSNQHKELIILKNKVPIEFKAFVGKRIGEYVYKGCITAISEDELKIESEEDISSLREIDLSNRIYHYLYAKSFEYQTKNGIFRFTSKPTDFPKWYKRVLLAGETERTNEK